MRIKLSIDIADIHEISRLVSECRYSTGCPLSCLTRGKLVFCPFLDRACSNVEEDDWEKLLKDGFCVSEK